MATLAVRAEQAPFRMRMEDIGGGRVIRQFRSGGKLMRTGETMTAEQIVAINPANRTSLIGRFIDVWPKPAGVASSSAGKADRAERATDASAMTRHVVPLGFGRYHVIQGELLTENAVTREEAYALAGIPLPPSKTRREKEH